MARYRNDTSGCFTFTDEVLCKQTNVSPNETFWAEPSATLSAATVLDSDDGYGVKLRRVCVSATDVSDDPTNYVNGSAGQTKILDEFRGVGDSESLSGLFFKRIIFRYQDTSCPTKWTEMMEFEAQEP